MKSVIKGSIHPAKQLLALVRASLWQCPADEGSFTGPTINWQKIWELAIHQTIVISMIEGAMSLPPEYRPPKEWMNRALTFIERNRRTHILIDNCLAEAVANLRDKGIGTILLKGQAYARSYPRPEIRQCGDIDLYVGESNFRASYSYIKEIGWKSCDRFIADAKHHACYLNGVRIELHRIAGKLSTKAADRKFQEWSMRQLNGSIYYLDIRGERIILPPPIFDVVFVFMHMYLHFMNSGIGMRHICDWAMLLHKHFNDINKKELKTLLEEFHLMKGWTIFAPIAVDYLGLPSEECPFYSPHNKKKAENVLRLIMREGNFGRAKKPRSVHPDGYLARKLFFLKRHSARIFSKFGIDPYLISIIYIKLAIRVMIRVRKNIMKRK